MPGREPPPLDRLVGERALDQLRDHLAGQPPVKLIAELSRLSDEDLAVAFRVLDRTRALAVFELLDPSDQQRLIRGMRSEVVRDLVAGLEPDDRARLVDELPASVARRLLLGLDPEDRADTAVLLGYPSESAGRIMTPEVVRLGADMTVAEALATVRTRGAEAETVYTLPVTDGERHLRGVVDLRSLLLTDDHRRVAEIMDADPLRVDARTDQETAARLIGAADLLAVPVVDSEDRLLGVITVDDAMAVIEQEETEDSARQSGAAPLGRPYLSASVWSVARSRAVWLLVLIVAAALTVNVLRAFESTLSEVVTLAVFIPLLIGTGGNTGAQAATTVIRAMAIDELRFSDLSRVAWREARVGLVLGLLLGGVSVAPVAVLFGGDMALVVASTLVAVCTWAALAGAVLPLLARRAGVDPAVVSAPLVTTLVDASGLLLYFLIARAVLGV